MVMEKIHPGVTPQEMGAIVSIDTKTNPDLRHTVITEHS